MRTRFVVDIITGTSAGGINGVFLAKALATDRDISALSDLWVKEGDIDSLLNNAGATAGTRLRPQRPPLSVLSGQRMLYLLLAALDRVSGATPRAGVPDPVTSPYADQIDLWITTTDLQGRPVTVQTWNPDRLGEIREADHRTTFHFRYDATEPAVDGQTGVFNTLGPSHDPLLAFAARCTSSFPGAFQAVKLDDLGEVIDGVRPGATAGAAGWIGPSDPKLDPFFAEYGGVGPAAGHSFADGGYLDNQPVDLVMETLPKRRADIPVARRILLVDPDPGAEPVPGQASVVPDVPPVDPLPRDAPRVDLLGTLVKVVSLPRVQTIGGDVDKILALRGPCRVRSSVYAALDAKLLGTAPPPAGVDDGTPADVAYETLRWATAADELGEAIARVGFPVRQYPADSQHQAIASRIISAWNAVPADPAGAAAITLDDLDLGFELRRINFVQARLGQRTRKGATTVDDARRIRRALDDAYAAAAARARALRFRDPNPPPDRARVLDAVREQLGVVERNVQFGAPPSELDADLRARLQPGTALRAALDELLRMFVTALKLDDVRRSGACRGGRRRRRGVVVRVVHRLRPGDVAPPRSPPGRERRHRSRPCQPPRHLAAGQGPGRQPQAGRDAGPPLRRLLQRRLAPQRHPVGPARCRRASHQRAVARRRAAGAARRAHHRSPRGDHRRCPRGPRVPGPAQGARDEPARAGAGRQEGGADSAAPARRRRRRAGGDEGGLPAAAATAGPGDRADGGARRPGRGRRRPRPPGRAAARCARSAPGSGASSRSPPGSSRSPCPSGPGRWWDAICSTSPSSPPSS